MFILNQRDHQMNRYGIAAIAVAGMMFVATPALAVNPEAIVGGVISGVLGGVVGGDCYFNDCGYDNGYYGGGGGGYGGGGRGYRGGGRGGGGGRAGHGGAAHASAGHGGGRR
jgi:hypothetical protein